MFVTGTHLLRLEPTQMSSQALSGVGRRGPPLLRSKAASGTALRWEYGAARSGPSLLFEHLTAHLVTARQLLQHQKVGE